MQILILASSSSIRLKILSTFNIKPDIIISPDIDESRLKNESPIALSKRLAYEKAMAIYRNLENIIQNNLKNNNKLEQINANTNIKNQENNTKHLSAKNKELIDSKNIDHVSIDHINIDIDHTVIDNISINSNNEIITHTNINKDNKNYAYILAADSVICAGAKVLNKSLTKEENLNNISLLSGKKHRCYSAFCIIKVDLTNLSIINKVTKFTLTSVIFKRFTESEKAYYINSSPFITSVYETERLAGRFIKSINGSLTGLYGLPLCEVINTLESLGFKTF